MTKELIEDIRAIIVPYMAHDLRRINYENMGEIDAEQFSEDMNEILDLAAKALEQEPCEDAISRDDALMCMTGEYIADKEYKPEDIISKHIRRLRALPPVQPKIKVGHWIDGHCSECGCDVPAYIIDWKWQRDMDAKYCPNCGAKMESEDRE